MQNNLPRANITSGLGSFTFIAFFASSRNLVQVEIGVQRRRKARIDVCKDGG